MLTQYDIKRNRAPSKWRTFKRLLSRKSLPSFVYRLDGRDPQVIAQTGFQPWNPQGNINIFEHVKGVLDTGNAAKLQSQYVSTSSFQAYSRFGDGRMGEMLTRSRIYKIDTHIALTTGEFFDVNDMFDRFSQTNNFRAQREWSKLGGIPANAVIGFMSGLDFFNNVILVPAPQEDELRWEPMPARI